MFVNCRLPYPTLPSLSKATDIFLLCIDFFLCYTQKTTSIPSEYQNLIQSGWLFLQSSGESWHLTLWI